MPEYVDSFEDIYDDSPPLAFVAQHLKSKGWRIDYIPPEGNMIEYLIIFRDETYPYAFIFNYNGRILVCDDGDDRGTARTFRLEDPTSLRQIEAAASEIIK
jgi:hypothetical protein